MQRNRRPLNAFREAFAEDFLRREVEAHGFDPDFSTMGALRRLGRELRAAGMQPGREQARAAVGSAFRLARTMRAVAALKSAQEKGIPWFVEDGKRIAAFDNPVQEFRPYGHGTAVGLRAYQRVFGNDSRGRVHFLSPNSLKELLHPELKRLLRNHGVELADLRHAFAISGKALETREHEFEHQWSSSIHGDYSPAGEEVAAKYKGGLSSDRIIIELLNPPFGGEEAYWASLGLKPRQTTILKSLLSKKRRLETRLQKARQAGSGEEAAAAERELDGVFSELRAWRDKNKAFWGDRLEANLSLKKRHLKRTRYLQNKHGISVNLMTALFRTNPIEHVATIIEAAVKLGKLPAKK